MFVHIGGNTVLPVKNIVGIFDVGILEDKATRDFLQIAEEEGFVKDNKLDKKRSFVLTGQNVYFSPISSATLKKRIHMMYKRNREGKLELELEVNDENSTDNGSP